MTRLDRVLKAVECCSAAVRCHQCPYQKYRAGETASERECQKELMLDLCAEIGVDADGAWWAEE